MVDTRVLVVFALLQITCFLFHDVSAATCHASGFIPGKGRNCDREIGLDRCCVAGKRYPQFRCSPPVSAKTPAILRFNRFESGEDATRITSCDMRFHRDKELLITFGVPQSVLFFLILFGTKKLVSFCFCIICLASSFLQQVERVLIYQIAIILPRMDTRENYEPNLENMLNNIMSSKQ
ncbi:putative ripening-related protein 4 [Panicum miliaceum]|uniref:Ripening-related protein 4 n=1 Tax=Panicum miliaceum TaxID=4540 RepID=A0A3L6SD81_PANMI|nr:putative ripening-related protein 4 [Panicum miliaceum]